MSLDVIAQEQEGVLIITLDRPKANAINAKTSQKLYQILNTFQADPKLKVAIITGQGERFFSAGWDLKSAIEGEAIDADHGLGGFAGLTENFMLTKPVIGAINGVAVGGGFELALACDFLIAAKHAKFFVPEVKLGIVPDSGGIFRLVRNLPKVVAMQLLLTGEPLSAEQAKNYGLVNQVVESDQLMASSMALANQLKKGAPLAQQAIKELILATQNLSLSEAFALQRSGDKSLKTYQAMLTSEDAKEGIRAFAEKREPKWQGV